MIFVYIRFMRPHYLIILFLLFISGGAVVLGLGSLVRDGFERAVESASYRGQAVYTIEYKAVSREGLVDLRVEGLELRSRNGAVVSIPSVILKPNLAAGHVTMEFEPISILLPNGETLDMGKTNAKLFFTLNEFYQGLLGIREVYPYRSEVTVAQSTGFVRFKQADLVMKNIKELAGTFRDVESSFLSAKRLSFHGFSINQLPSLVSRDPNARLSSLVDVKSIEAEHLYISLENRGVRSEFMSLNTVRDEDTASELMMKNVEYVDVHTDTPKLYAAKNINATIDLHMLENKTFGIRKVTVIQPEFRQGTQDQFQILGTKLFAEVQPHGGMKINLMQPLLRGGQKSSEFLLSLLGFEGSKGFVSLEWDRSPMPTKIKSAFSNNVFKGELSLTQKADLVKSIHLVMERTPLQDIIREVLRKTIGEERLNKEVANMVSQIFAIPNQQRLVQTFASFFSNGEPISLNFALIEEYSLSQTLDLLQKGKRVPVIWAEQSSVHK